MGETTPNRPSSATNLGFDFYLQFAKPLVLNLPDPTDRSLAAAWVKKLRDETGNEELRTEYIKLLLFVLNRRKMLGPFANAPHDGKLNEFPSGMKIIDVAHDLMVKEEQIRSQRGQDHMHGSGDFPPYEVEISADYTEFASSQLIPNFGVQVFYAFSNEPIHAWENTDIGVVPKQVLEDSTKRVAHTTPTSSLRALKAKMVGEAQKSASPKTPMKTQRSTAKANVLFEGIASTPHRMPSPIDLAVRRRPVTWGSNLIEVLEPPASPDDSTAIRTTPKTSRKGAPRQPRRLDMSAEIEPIPEFPELEEEHSIHFDESIENILNRKYSPKARYELDLSASPIPKRSPYSSPRGIPREDLSTISPIGTRRMIQTDYFPLKFVEDYSGVGLADTSIPGDMSSISGGSPHSPSFRLDESLTARISRTPPRQHQLDLSGSPITKLGQPLTGITAIDTSGVSPSRGAGARSPLRGHYPITLEDQNWLDVGLDDVEMPAEMYDKMQEEAAAALEQIVLPTTDKEAREILEEANRTLRGRPAKKEPHRGKALPAKKGGDVPAKRAAASSQRQAPKAGRRVAPPSAKKSAAPKKSVAPPTPIPQFHDPYLKDRGKNVPPTPPLFSRYKHIREGPGGNIVYESEEFGVDPSQTFVPARDYNFQLDDLPYEKRDRFQYDPNRVPVSVLFPGIELGQYDEFDEAVPDFSEIDAFNISLQEDLEEHIRRLHEDFADEKDALPATAGVATTTPQFSLTPIRRREYGSDFPLFEEEPEFYSPEKSPESQARAQLRLLYEGQELPAHLRSPEPDPFGLPMPLSQMHPSTIPPRQPVTSTRLEFQDPSPLGASATLQYDMRESPSTRPIYPSLKVRSVSPRLGPSSPQQRRREPSSARSQTADSIANKAAEQYASLYDALLSPDDGQTASSQLTKPSPFKTPKRQYRVPQTPPIDLFGVEAKVPFKASKSFFDEDIPKDLPSPVRPRYEFPGWRTPEHLRIDKPTSDSPPYLPVTVPISGSTLQQETFPEDLYEDFPVTPPREPEREFRDPFDHVMEEESDMYDIMQQDEPLALELVAHDMLPYNKNFAVRVGASAKAVRLERKSRPPTISPISEEPEYYHLATPPRPKIPKPRPRTPDYYKRFKMQEEDIVAPPTRVSPRPISPQQARSPSRFPRRTTPERMVNLPPSPSKTYDNYPEDLIGVSASVPHHVEKSLLDDEIPLGLGSPIRAPRQFHGWKTPETPEHLKTKPEEPLSPFYAFDMGMTPASEFLQNQPAPEGFYSPKVDRRTREDYGDPFQYVLPEDDEFDLVNEEEPFLTQVVQHDWQQYNKLDHTVFLGARGKPYTMPRKNRGISVPPISEEPEFLYIGSPARLPPEPVRINFGEPYMLSSSAPQRAAGYYESPGRRSPQGVAQEIMTDTQEYIASQIENQEQQHLLQDAVDVVQQTNVEEFDFNVPEGHSLFVGSPPRQFGDVDAIDAEAMPTSPFQYGTQQIPYFDFQENVDDFMPEYGLLAVGEDIEMLDGAPPEFVELSPFKEDEYNFVYDPAIAAEAQRESPVARGGRPGITKKQIRKRLNFDQFANERSVEQDMAALEWRSPRKTPSPNYKKTVIRQSPAGIVETVETIAATTSALGENVVIDEKQQYQSPHQTRPIQTTPKSRKSPAAIAQPVVEEVQEVVEVEHFVHSPYQPFVLESPPRSPPRAEEMITTEEFVYDYDVGMEDDINYMSPTRQSPERQMQSPHTPLMFTGTDWHLWETPPSGRIHSHRPNPPEIPFEEFVDPGADIESMTPVDFYSSPTRQGMESPVGPETYRTVTPRASPVMTPGTAAKMGDFRLKVATHQIPPEFLDSNRPAMRRFVRSGSRQYRLGQQRPLLTRTLEFPEPEYVSPRIYRPPNYYVPEGDLVDVSYAPQHAPAPVMQHQVQTSAARIQALADQQYSLLHDSPDIAGQFEQVPDDNLIDRPLTFAESRRLPSAIFEPRRQLDWESPPRPTLPVYTPIEIPKRKPVSPPALRQEVQFEYIDEEIEPELFGSPIRRGDIFEDDEYPGQAIDDVTPEYLYDSPKHRSPPFTPSLMRGSPQTPPSRRRPHGTPPSGRMTYSPPLAEVVRFEETVTRIPAPVSRTPARIDYAQGRMMKPKIRPRRLMFNSVPTPSPSPPRRSPQQAQYMSPPTQPARVVPRQTPIQAASPMLASPRHMAHQVRSPMRGMKQSSPWGACPATCPASPAAAYYDPEEQIEEAIMFGGNYEVSIHDTSDIPLDEGETQGYDWIG